MTKIKSHNTDAHFEKLLRANGNIFLAPEYQQNINTNQTSIETQGSSDPVLTHCRDFLKCWNWVSDFWQKSLLQVWQIAESLAIYQLQA